MKSLNLGKNLKKYRKEKGLTQKQLAELIGVVASTVTKYENNQLEPNIDTLNKIASVLEVSFDELLGESTSDFNDKVPKKEELTKLFREGMIIITASGVTIKDKIVGCYTFNEDGETYIIVKFSNGHVVVNIENVKKINDMMSTLCEWQYDLLNFDGPLCSIIKLKED